MFNGISLVYVVKFNGDLFVNCCRFMIRFSHFSLWFGLEVSLSKSDANPCPLFSLKTLLFFHYSQ